MNIYQVKYKSESIRCKVSISEKGYKRKEFYYDLNGKIAYKGIKSIDYVTTKCEAVSIEGVKTVFYEETYDYMGHIIKLCMDVEIELIEEGDIKPFEKLNTMYCKPLRSMIFNNTVDIEEVDILCSKEVQEEYQTMSIEARKNYLNGYIIYDDF